MLYNLGKNIMLLLPLIINGQRKEKAPDSSTHSLDCRKHNSHFHCGARNVDVRR